MRLVILLVFSLQLFGQAPAGRRAFDTRCVSCHGGDARGGEHGPNIVGRLASRNDDELASLIREGLPNAGMPGFKMPDAEMKLLVGYLRSLPAREGDQRPTKKFETGSGSIEGTVLNEGAHEAQIRSADGRLRLLRKEGNVYREVTSQADWSTYNGTPNGNRFTNLSQITPSNVSRLVTKWTFPLPNTSNLQVTPVVVGGIMYVTSANECYALDAGSGREIWHYRRPRTKNLTGNAAGGINRGVAVEGDRLFMVTDHAHIIALQRHTGALLWDTEMADWQQNYNATSAPLVAGGLVISGTAGGDEGVRGFLAAFDQKTGKEVWRFWTVPKRGEPGSETWKGRGIEHPGAVTWFTGSYDAGLDTIYWQVGNPGPDLDDTLRPGDNLYSCSTIALDRKTGKLKWHFQYTPHDVWDWDAEQPEVLVDSDWEGAPRKLLLHANRNGFFYVLDRVDGKLLSAKPFVKKLDWATGIDSKGRPIQVPGKMPTEKGNAACPSLEGATNWFSTSYNPGTGLYYLQALEKCSVYVKTFREWAAGKGYMGGSTRNVPGDNPQKFLRAIDIKTGRIAWEVPQAGHGETWGGVLGTATGLVFYCDDDGSFRAVDAKDGKPLWSFAANAFWKASPMAYEFDGKEYIAVAAGANIVVFGLLD